MSGWDYGMGVFGEDKDEVELHPGSTHDIARSNDLTDQQLLERLRSLFADETIQNKGTVVLRQGGGEDKSEESADERTVAVESGRVESGRLIVNLSEDDTGSVRRRSGLATGTALWAADRLLLLVRSDSGGAAPVTLPTSAPGSPAACARADAPRAPQPPRA